MHNGNTGRSRVSPILLDRIEAADALRLSLRKIDALISRHQIAVVRIGGSVRIALSELERFITSQTERSSQAEQLRIVRTRAGLSPEELADRVGVPVSLVERAEAGEPLPRKTFAELVAVSIYTWMTMQVPA